MDANESEAVAPCHCSDWQENVGYLDNLVLFRWLHGGKSYRGKPFVYCPWCGSKLEVESSSGED